MNSVKNYYNNLKRCDEKLNKEDAINYDQELFGNSGEITLEIQPLNIEVLQADCEECIDFCSEYVKKKIK